MTTRTLGALVALAGSALCFNAHAATYRCDVAGSVYLTDKPCAPAPMPPAAQVATLQAGTPSAEPATASRLPGEARSKDRTPAQRADAGSPQDADLLTQRCTALRDALRSLQATTDAERATKRVADAAYNAHCLGQ